MSKKVGFLQRWMFIIDKISAHPYISKEELEYAVEHELHVYDGVTDIGLKPRTLRRDIHEIRNAPYMDISIEYCHKRKGYYIPKDEKSISKLERLFELSSLFSFSNLKDIVLGEDRKPSGLEYRFDLIRAIQKTVEIVIEYRKFNNSDNSLKARRLQPYALKEFRRRWYLLATETGQDFYDNNSLKTFGLDRIEKLTLTASKFRKSKDIDIKKKFEHCFGIFSNHELVAERVVLSFSPLSGRYNDAYPLHKSQKVLIHNEKEFRVELTVKLTPDFISELLFHSEGMKVIEPERLKETLIGVHQRAIQLLEE